MENHQTFLEEAEHPDFSVPCSLESLPTQQTAFLIPTQENGIHPNSPFSPQTLLEIKLKKNIFLKLKQVEFSALKSLWLMANVFFIVYCFPRFYIFSSSLERQEMSQPPFERLHSLNAISWSTGLGE